MRPGARHCAPSSFNAAAARSRFAGADIEDDMQPLLRSSGPLGVGQRTVVLVDTVVDRCRRHSHVMDPTGTEKGQECRRGRGDRATFVARHRHTGHAYPPGLLRPETMRAS